MGCLNASRTHWFEFEKLTLSGTDTNENIAAEHQANALFMDTLFGRQKTGGDILHGLRWRQCNTVSERSITGRPVTVGAPVV